MSIRLTTGSRIAETSSKGKQKKWLADGRWYKLDLFGYEGLAEAVTSALLAQTNTDALGFRYVTYRMERMDVAYAAQTDSTLNKILMIYTIIPAVFVVLQAVPIFF